MLGHNDRVRGFRSVLKDTDLRVAEILECNDDDKTAYEKTARLLKNRPALCAVYVAAAGVAGTVEAVAESGVPLFIIANDLIPATREYVRQGRVLATIDQQPRAAGLRGAQKYVRYPARRASRKRALLYRSGDPYAV